MNETAVVPIQAASPIIISGPTGSGKTHFVNRLLQNDMFTQPISSILYCYGVYQTYFNTIDLPNMEFYEGLPTLEKIKSMNDGKFHVIVLDDLMEHIVKSIDMQSLFTKHCHHFNISAIFITHNIFAQGPYARTITLNAHVLVLFANKRDESQTEILARQLYPGAPRVFREAYADATSLPYGYLLVDCSPNTPVEFKLRSKIFPGEDTVCYISKV